LFALIGGAFGWGLKRNVIDLYIFLCRNYRPGDQIFGFGYSRGAFTIRVLAGLVANQGLVTAADGREATLERLALDAFRA
ncbi:phospholipase effector Tle1 domain-containing protein, partial [Klebsiella pneumoniae]|uniref:phospholipase effector Tle1 domain-containing protein n=1 Tax=Klebsiella pneumoniae TaxID=573 RepID=UPI00376F1986